MTTMISEVYEAFLSVGVPKDVARKAAEALSSESLATKSDISTLDKKIDASISALDKKIDASISALDKKIDAAVLTLDKRIDAAVLTLDKRIDAAVLTLDKRIQVLTTEFAVMKWMLGVVIAGISALVLKAFT